MLYVKDINRNTSESSEVLKVSLFLNALLKRVNNFRVGLCSLGMMTVTFLTG